jgi:carboxypeptidase Q
MRYLVPVLAVLAAAPLCPQERNDRADLAIVGRIKTEAFDNSRVMETLGYLTDVYGPRLSASPEFREAADWAMKRLASYGVENVRLEKWGPFARSWSLKQSSVEMIEPRYASLDAAPLAWSDQTKGPVTADVILAPLGNTRRTQDPVKIAADFKKYMDDWKGKLRGKIVLLATKSSEPTPDSQPLFTRYSDKELGDLAQAPTPFARLSDVRDLKFPDDPAEERRYVQALPPSVREQLGDIRDDLNKKRAKFFREEGAVAILNSSDASRDGLLFAQSAGSYEAKDALAVPTFVVTREQYNRIVRLTEQKIPVKIRVSLQMESSDRNADSFNVTGEIPGGARKDEVIMIGAHLDSWHAGTGATDNAAGCATMIEVMRIVKALNLKLDRTVRIGLWSGEEQGIFGSKAYVKEHFGDPETMKLTEAHAKFSGYFNLDNGSGKIRGVYLQNNDAMRPIFEQWLSPFRDQGVTTVSIRNTGGTDHLSFDAVGLPGFQFIQDPLEYDSITHHSNMDTLDHAQPADLMQAAAVIATVVYQAANRPDLLPRKALPQPQPKAKITIDAAGDSR